MIEFPTIESFIAYLETTLPAAIIEGAGLGVEAATERWHAEARKMLGHLNAGAGGVPGWDALSDITVHEREIHGYPGDEPLLVTEDLRSHIEFSVDKAALIGAVGVPSVMVGDHDRADGDPHTRLRDIGDVARRQELGIGVPERSFLALSGATHGEAIVKTSAAPVVAALAGERWLTKRQEADEIPF